jgi:hypothetical protein
MINVLGTYKSHIDKEPIIYIFKTVFISSFKNVILIKNGRGNRPDDAVATDPNFSGRQVLNPARQLAGKMR